MKARARIVDVVLAVTACVAALSCGGGGGDDNSDTVVSGTVRSPNGQPIGLQDSANARRRRVLLDSPLGLQMTGLLPVPDGTPVELVRLDATGQPLVSIASTVTAAGGYAFNLSSLGIAFASDLAVVAGSGATIMRSLAVQSSVDVDPLSEAALQLILQQSAGLDPFTLKEAGDVDAAVRLLALADSITAQADVASTVALILQSVQGSSSLVAFLGTASAPGQTSEGPGDMGDYFPSTVSNTWRFECTHSIDGGAPVAYSNSQRVVALDAFGVHTVEELDPLDTGSAVREFLEKTSTGIVNHGSDDPEDPVSPLVVPYDEARFPLRVHDSFAQFDAHGLSLGQDLDGDGVAETFNARSVRTIEGFEDVGVPAGTFANCVRLDTRGDTTLFLSGGGSATSSLVQSDWFAPHLGPVRTEATLTISVPGETTHEVFVEVLAAYQVDGQGHGILPPVTLAAGLSQANSDTETPGRPGLGFDGTNYLLVTVRHVGLSDQLVGVRLTQTGLVIDEFPILDMGITLQFADPSVVFDGTNYLVVFQTGGQVLGVRVATDGTVLDLPAILISTTGTSNFLPAVAFDGTNSLVAWRAFDSMHSGDIHASRVTPAGIALGDFVVHSAPGDQLLPAMAFGDGNTLIVWTDEESGTSQIRGARVTPAGDVLDAAGFDVTTGAGEKFDPQVSFDGSRYLVVWQEQTVQLTSRILARRLEADGTPSDPAPFPIITTALPNENAALAFDGTNFFVAWDVATFDASSGLYARRVSPDGRLLDGPADSTGLAISRPPDFARLVHPRILFGNGHALLAWVVNTELFGTLKDVVGSLVYPF